MRYDKLRANYLQKVFLPNPKTSLITLRFLAVSPYLCRPKSVFADSVGYSKFSDRE